MNFIKALSNLILMFTISITVLGVYVGSEKLPYIIGGLIVSLIFYCATWSMEETKYRY